jgi:hypothetical protein
MSIPRWVLEDVDPVRAYAQILTFGEHRVAAVLGLGWADIRVGRQLHRISAVQAQLLWLLTCDPGLTNGQLSELCHVSDSVRDAALSELNGIGALADSRSVVLDDDAPTVMGSAQLPQTSIHIGSACIDAVFWLCKRIKEANGVVDELEACNSCSSATGSPPAVVVSVVIDLVRRGIVYRRGGYLIAPAVGGDAAQISLLPPSAAAAHSSAVPWPLIPPFERLVLVKMDETPPACHSFISSSFSSACVDEAAFKNDLMTTLSDLVKHSATRDILAVSSLFQECGSVISFAAKTVFDGDAGQPVELPAFAAMSLEETCVREACTMCLDEKPLAEFMQPPCGHAKCRQCFTEYFSTAIKDSQTPARALGKQGLSITNLKCSECDALIPLSFFQQVSPGLSSELARVLSSIVINNLVAGQCAFARCVCSAILLAPTQECEAFCSCCGRAASIGNFKRQSFSEAWNHLPDLSSHESLNWKLLNSSGNSDRIGVLRYKPCPSCGVMSTRCGCDPKNIICDKLERCPSERCDHMSCAACGMNWCWVCSAKNSTESRCSRPSSERTDRKERFLVTSSGIQKLTGSAAATSFLAAPSVCQRVASRLVRQFFDGDAHHSPLPIDQLQRVALRERCRILLPRMISLMPLLPSVEFISWSTVNRAAAAIRSIPLPDLFKALEIQSDTDAAVAIATLLGCSPTIKHAPLRHVGILSACGGNWAGISACSGGGNCSSRCRNCGAGTHWTCCGSDDRSSAHCDVPITQSQAEENHRLFRVVRNSNPVPCRDIEGLSGGRFSIAVSPLQAGAPSTAAPSTAAPSTAVEAWAPGKRVTLSSQYAQHGDAARGPLKPNEVATIAATEAEGGIVLVCTAGGREVILLRFSFAAKLFGLLSCSGGTTGLRSQSKFQMSPSRHSVLEGTCWSLIHSHTSITVATSVGAVSAQGLLAFVAVAAILICVQAALVKFPAAK